MNDKKYKIVLADDGIKFHPRSLEEGPLGGAECAFIKLAEAFAKKGHTVYARNNCEKKEIYNGVDWAPIKDGLPKENVDLYIANRGDRLILKMPNAKKTVFWVHNPCKYLLKFRYLWKLLIKKPDIVFVGDYHATTLPKWVPTGVRKTIPLGLLDEFLDAPSNPNPKKRAIFTSNPLRGLDWLLKIWEEKIFPNTKNAELHVFSGPSTYGFKDNEKAKKMNEVIEKAKELKNKGVVIRTPVPKKELMKELQDSKTLLYKGDINETFCLAVGEAQALGVPCVVKPIGSVVERIKDKQTGFIAQNDEEFAEYASKLLEDEKIWKNCHENALKYQRNWSWEKACEEFLKLI